MPWKESSVMDERARFVFDVQKDVFTVTELCDRYGISRKTAYKWLARHAEGGVGALADVSKAPFSHPNTTDPEIVDAIVKFRRKHPTWGPRKILRVLSQRAPEVPWPAHSTTSDIIARHGLVKPRRRRSKLVHPGRPTTDFTGPNDIWAADFKGQFQTQDGQYCYPLTVSDGFSRYLLACKGLPSVADKGARPVFKALFREYGLPSAILTDNGTPFASIALHRLSRLSVWWIKLGIMPLLIEPGHPEQNGRHERMHRTLKKEATRPPRKNMRAQQREFDRFRAEYNEIRPHDALDLDTPASWYQASPRPFPEVIKPYGYPQHFQVRKVATNAQVKWHSRCLAISRVLIGEHIGLEEIDDGLWSVHFCDVLIGRFDEKVWKLHA
jgi:transposase InsO family protein